MYHYQKSFLFLFTLVVYAVDGLYNDNVFCEDFPDAANMSTAQLENETERLGQCIPYSAKFLRSNRTNVCDRFYEIGEDRVYLPTGKALDDLRILNEFAADASLVLNLLGPTCREPAWRAICYYYYSPCGNSTDFQPPNELCQDICSYVADDVCKEEWQTTLVHLGGVSEIVERYQLHFLNCSQPGAPLGALPHCCSDAGVEIVHPTAVSSSTDDQNSSSVVSVAASVSATLAVLMVVAIIIVLAAIIFAVKKSKNNNNNIILNIHGDSIKSNKQAIPEIMLSRPTTTAGSSMRYVDGMETLAVPPDERGLDPVRIPRASSGFIRDMSNSNLLIPGRHIQLLETVGQGEFGVVYRGKLTFWQGRTKAELVAVKTLKSFFSKNDIDELLKESEKMKSFDHPNVLSLIGVSIDAGEAPFIVMPFMANGSLLAYLRKERPHLTIAEEASAGDQMVADAQRKLLSICLQIAKGMSYLAEHKFIHRDLAARNCMIDKDFVIKVADFGLSEDVYSRNYFRQGQGEEGSPVKLPIKWMALESILDGIFTEKTDVWSYGVTCWEIFSLGYNPYPVIDPYTLPKFLKSGERLEKPANAACTPLVYEVITGCWSESADKRPSFKDLVQVIDRLLVGVSGYLDFSAFPSNNQSREYNHLESYNHLENIA